MDGKRVKRLDKSIHCLMNMLQSFARERLLKNFKGYSGKKIYEIDKRHKKCLIINCPIVESFDPEGKYWFIQSTTSGHDIYEIREGEPDCQCQLRCKICDLCLHTMTCTCPDYYGANLCKHIHYWQRKQ